MWQCLESTFSRQKFTIITDHNGARKGHFRVPFASVSKRVQVRNLSHKNQFSSQVHSDANQTHFHMKGFALGLVLKRR